MAQQYSSANQPQQIKKSHQILNDSQHLQQHCYKKSRQIPFYKSPIISFVKVGLCHMCKFRNKIVYQCHKNYQATSCEKRFCLDCLILIYKQNIIQKIQKDNSWKCPYIRKVCRCKNCCQSRKQTYAVLQIDPNMSVYSNLRMRISASKLTLNQQTNNVSNQQKIQKQPSLMQNQQEQVQSEHQQNQIDQSMRCLIRQKFKRVIDFNGQLINKVNTNYHKLTEEEIKFYNKLIYSNLKVLNNIANNMIANQSLIEE